jgi:hypothetical protein
MIDPNLYSDVRATKRAAAVLANACGATLLQVGPHGRIKRVILGNIIKDFDQWLAAWSWLHQIRADQIGANRPKETPPAPAKAREPPKQPPVPPTAKLAPPMGNLVSSNRRSATVLPPMAIILDD